MFDSSDIMPIFVLFHLHKTLPSSTGRLLSPRPVPEGIVVNVGGTLLHICPRAFLFPPFQSVSPRVRMEHHQGDEYSEQYSEKEFQLTQLGVELLNLLRIVGDTKIRAIPRGIRVNVNDNLCLVSEVGKVYQIQCSRIALRKGVVVQFNVFHLYLSQVSELGLEVNGLVVVRKNRKTI